MLARHKTPSLDLDELTLTANADEASSNPGSEWVESDEAFSKAVSAKRQHVAKASTEYGYLDLCKLLKLPAKRFQIFEVADKQRLVVLAKQFETWVSEANINLEHMIPSVLFWQQFDFASIAPANFNVDAINKNQNTFKEMPLFEPKNIFYFKGGDLGHLLFDDDEKNLNVVTGNEKKFQFHLVKTNLHPYFIRFLESR